MAKTKTRTEHPDLSEAGFDQKRQYAHRLAQQEFEAANGDRVKAHAALVKITEDAPDLVEGLQAVVFDKFWRDFLHLCTKNQRKRISFKVRNEEDVKPWTAPATLGEGLTAKRQNMDMIYDYQFPFLVKAIGLATPVEFSHAFGKVQARHETDEKLIGLGEAIKKRIAKADRDSIIQDIVSAEELARIFRQSGVVK